MAVLAMGARVLLHPVVARVVALSTPLQAPSPGHQVDKVLDGRPHHYMVIALRAPPWAPPVLVTHPRHASRPEAQHLRLLHPFTVLQVRLEYLPFRLATALPRQLSTLLPVLITLLPVLSSLPPRPCTRQPVLSLVALELQRSLQQAHLRRHLLILRRLPSGRLSLLSTALHHQWPDHQPLPCRLLILPARRNSPPRLQPSLYTAIVCHYCVLIVI
jgi:hypothetical protein